MVNTNSSKNNGSNEKPPGDTDDETCSRVSTFDAPPDEAVENEELIHARMHRERHKLKHQEHQHRQHENHRHHHHHHHNNQHHEHHHRKELIKPDPTEKLARSPQPKPAGPVRPVASSSSQTRTEEASGATVSEQPPVATLIATAVDEEQLRQRLAESVSEKRLLNRMATNMLHPSDSNRGSRSEASTSVSTPTTTSSTSATGTTRRIDCSSSSRDALKLRSKSSSSSSFSSSSGGNSVPDEARALLDRNLGARKSKSPPPMKIIIPPSVAHEFTRRAQQQQQQRLQVADARRAAPLTREQLKYGPLLKANEVQLLYRSPDVSANLDRLLKEEQAKQVAPNQRQSPIAIMSMNPCYALQNKPLRLEYPATVENLRLNNTGFGWEAKLPYQLSMATALHGAHLNSTHRFRLDQFHCHWGSTDQQGSEHTVDNRSYSAEMHFVHYNMDKYHTLSKAARHPDGLAVLSVFIDAQEAHHKHAELEKICSHLKSVQLKGEHSIIRQAIRIENLLPLNRSYWSYQGSLTTPPFLESVTWFVLKHPIRCSSEQIRRFRLLKSTLRDHDHETPTTKSLSSQTIYNRTGSRDNSVNHEHRAEERDDDNDPENPGAIFIKSNHRKTQPLNGRTIVCYDE